MARQRDRGRILTEAGKEKIKQAIRAWEVEHERRCTQEQLKELTGLDPSTSSKILNARGGADRSKIEDFFRAFGLKLEEADLRSTQTISAPEPNPNFVGREDAISDLSTLVRRGAKLIVIQARGGVGKTTLAWEYLKTQGFDLVLELWMAKETQNIASVEGVIEEWLRRYFDEEPGREFGVTLERLRQKLRDPSQKIGILIDNLEPALDQSGKFIKAHRRYVELMRVLSDRAAQSVTLITSRERLQEADFGIEHYLLRSLDQQAWQQFFEHHSIQQDEAALTELHQAYGGNAKAMEILRSVVQADFDGDLAAYWQANQGDLFIERALEDLVVQQFDRLQQHDSGAYNLLCRMGCYRFQDVPTVPLEGLLCLLWDVPESKRRRVVRSLQERSVIETIADGYYLHPVIRAESIRRITATQDWITVNQKVAEYWTQEIKTVETVQDATRAFEAYFHYMSIGNTESAAFVIVNRRPSRWHAFIQGETLGAGFQRLGLLNKIGFTASEIVFNITSKTTQSGLYGVLGDFYVTEGNFQKAIESYQESGRLAGEYINLSMISSSTEEDLGAPWLCSVAPINLGICMIYLHEFEKASKYFEEALLISQNYSFHKYIQIFFEYYSAFVYSALGLIEKASSLAEKSYKKINLIGLNTRPKGFRLLFLGLTYTNINSASKAFEMFEQAIKYAKENHYAQIEAQSLYGLAELQRNQGKLEEALSNNLKSLEILETIRVKPCLAESYYQLGLTYYAIGDVEKANENFQEAVWLYTYMGASKQIRRVRQSMGT